MSLKIVSLNIWRYYEWEARKEKIFSFLQEKNPDVILFQETVYDPNFSSKDQTQDIAEVLGYPYSLFSSTGLKYSQKGQILKVPIQMGQGVISKYPFTQCENIFLKKDPIDKVNRLLQNFTLEYPEKPIHFSHVHFSNSDTWAENHLKETMNIFEKRQEKRIIVEDFNIKNLSQYVNLYTHGYISSADKFRYESYPQKHENLDYILLPNEFLFKKFECENTEISDHCPIYCEIDIF